MACCNEGGSCTHKVIVTTYNPETGETDGTETPACIAAWLTCGVVDCTCDVGECQRAVVDEQP